MKPNLLIFMPDQLRAETIGCYGHPTINTPSIDRFASESTVFESCFAVSPLCPVSRCDMFTGLPPHISGRRMFGNLLDENTPNVLRYLKEDGYDVYWYGRNDIIVQEGVKNCATEWNRFEDKPAWAIGSPYAEDDPLKYSLLFDEGKDHTLYPDYKRVQRAIEVLERRASDRPFCIFLPIFNPHPPFFGPKGFHGLYNEDDVPDLRPVNIGTRPKLYEEIRKSRNLNFLKDKDFRRINAVYMGMVSYVDYLFGKVLDTLEKTGHSQDTTVMFLSDHGEWAGDYGLVEKWGTSMDDVLLRVPLIIRQAKNRAARRVDEIVQLRDFMATVLDMAGITARHQHFSRSLVPLMEGAECDYSRVAFCEGGYRADEEHCFLPLERYHPNDIYYPKHYLEKTKPELISRTACVRTQEYKLVWRPDYVSELYDLKADPLELENVFGNQSYRSVEEQLVRKVLDWYVNTSDVVVQGRMPMELPPGN